MQKAQDKYEFRVKWEPFFLRPDTPEQGLKKPPDAPYNPRVSPRLKAAGEAVGINFTGASDVFPNTTLAHAVLEFAKEQDETGKKQDALAELLFKAYFTDGTPFTEDFLLSSAESAGLQKDAVQQYVSKQKNRRKAADKATAWSFHGVSGVPTFYMNGQKVFSGAQDEATFVKMFEIITEKHPVTATTSNM
ncbi:uncharacterized protein [Ptychodera flava]|uniref:uncharacterized protein n=1 Tax=Ptychodera flava TaxID=63121 RepID=UPI00396A6BCD